MANEIVRLPADTLRLFALLVVVLLTSASSLHASNTCPWMNEATASGLLGAEAVGAYHPASQELPATCAFTQHAGSITRVLRIQVEISKNPTAQLESHKKECGADLAPLPAIGNEAFFCTAIGSGKGLSEMAIGRVRDQVFVIELSTTEKRDTILSHGKLQSASHIAAEQVAGNLY
jgi:hypothetical protein